MATDKKNTIIHLARNTLTVENQIVLLVMIKLNQLFTLLGVHNFMIFLLFCLNAETENLAKDLAKVFVEGKSIKVHPKNSFPSKKK